MKKGGKTTILFRYDLNQVPYDYTAAVTNRISSDRVPGGLWAEVCDIVQEAVDQDHPQEKVMQTGKVVVQGGLTNSLEEKSSKRQRRKGKIFPLECRVHI